ncbi:MAG TPA: hypothetical protein VGV86_09905 [Acidimicrobiales bacterium]|nr:hypothetical protein [Acidimicrobiales bacterium]
MTLPTIATRDEWLAARKELLAKEKELTRCREPPGQARAEWEEPKGRSESARSGRPDFAS